jgi:trigger factor
MDNDTNDRLKHSLKDLSATRKEIEVELSAAEAAKEYETVLDTYAERAKLRGFRQGHAPRDMVKQMFGHEIEHDVIDSLVPRTMEELLGSIRLQAIGVPAIEQVHFEEGGPLTFKAVVETWPDFDLPDYKKLKLRKKSTAVTPEDIDLSLEELRRKNADFVPVEGRGAASGDYVTIEIQGRDLKTKRLLPAERVVVLVGREGNDPAVDENVLGLKAQEEKTFSVSYPADHRNRKLAGKTVENRLKVLTIKEMKYPELNDEFAKHLGEFETLAGLKEKILQELEANRARTARRETSEEAVQAVIDRAAIEVPAGVLEEETAAVLKNYASQIGSRGLTREAVDTLRVQARAQAERNLKQHLIIRRIAQAEGLSIADEDIDREIEAVALANNIPLARAKETFGEEERRDDLRASLLSRKVVDFLVGQAIME